MMHHLSREETAIKVGMVKRKGSCQTRDGQRYRMGIIISFRIPTCNHNTLPAHLPLFRGHTTFLALWFLTSMNRKERGSRRQSQDKIHGGHLVGGGGGGGRSPYSFWFYVMSMLRFFLAIHYFFPLLSVALAMVCDPFDAAIRAILMVLPKNLHGYWLLKPVVCEPNERWLSEPSRRQTSVNCTWVAIFTVAIEG